MSAQEVLRDAAELDRRRQHQIQNQINTINRLLAGGSYDDEIRELHEELAAAQAQADGLREEIEKLKPNTKENTHG